VIPIPQAHLQVSAGTHPGQRGKLNEDRYGVSAYILNESHPIPSVLAIVADGIGGHRAGEIAAEMAIESISRIVAASDATQPLETLRQAFTLTSQEIYRRAESNSELNGMGTTCACCWIISNRLYSASVGDSRIYLVRSGKIRQISTDHTWIQEALDLGVIAPDQARGHPNTHVIRRFLGSQEPPLPDLRLRLDPAENNAQAEANQGLALHAADQVLLCTDGLTDLVKSDEILGILQSQAGQNAVDSLIELANQRGGHDNITIVLLMVPKKVAKDAGRTQQRRNLMLACLSLVFLATLAGLFLASDWLFDRILHGDRNSKQTSSTPVITLTLEKPHSGAASTQKIIPTPTNPPLWHTPNPKSVPGVPIEPGQTFRPATLTPWPTNTP